MRNHKIQKSLQIRVFKNLEYIQNSESQSIAKGQELLKTISKNLRDDVLRDFFSRTFQESEIFKQNFNNQFLSALSQQMQEILLMPGESLFKCNEFSNKVFFVNKGEIEFFLKRKDQDYTICILKVFNLNYQSDEFINFIKNNFQQGMFFGYQSFFLGCPQLYSARSTAISHIVYINRQDALNILQNFPNDYETFCQIKDQIELDINNDFETCTICKQRGHNIIKCNKVHYYPDKQSIMQQYQCNYKQKRNQNSQRQQSKSMHAFKQHSLIRQQLMKCRINNYKDQETDSNLINIPTQFQLMKDEEFFNIIPKIIDDYSDNLDMQEGEGDGSQEDSGEIFSDEDKNSQESIISESINGSQSNPSVSYQTNPQIINQSNKQQYDVLKSTTKVEQNQKKLSFILEEDDSKEKDSSMLNCINQTQSINQDFEEQAQSKNIIRQNSNNKSTSDNQCDQKQQSLNRIEKQNMFINNNNSNQTKISNSEIIQNDNFMSNKLMDKVKRLIVILEGHPLIKDQETKCQQKNKMLDIKAKVLAALQKEQIQQSVIQTTVQQDQNQHSTLQREQSQQDNTRLTANNQYEEFDQIKIFKNYFPHNNIVNILKKNQDEKKKRKSRVRNRRQSRQVNNLFQSNLLLADKRQNINKTIKNEQQAASNNLAHKRRHSVDDKIKMQFNNQSIKLNK